MNLVSWDTSRAFPCGGIIACKFRSDLAKLESYSWKRGVVLSVKKGCTRSFWYCLKMNLYVNKLGKSCFNLGGKKSLA